MRPYLTQLPRSASFALVTLSLTTASEPGCLLLDYCISVGITGTEVCVTLDGPTGTTGGGEVDIIKDGIEAVTGCDCLYDDELAILEQAAPDSPEYEGVFGPIQNDAREHCVQLVIEKGLVDHNCDTVPLIDGFVLTGAHCVAGCAYGNPPPNGDCPDDAECNPLTASGETGSLETTTGETEETGDDDPPIREIMPPEATR